MASINKVATSAGDAVSASERLRGDPSPRGCSLPWVVRLKPASGNSPFRISGRIDLVYFRFDDDIKVEGELISLNKGNSVNKNIGDQTGLHAGNITVTGTWLHSISGVPGPLPVQLRFDLLDPTGSVVASKTAFSAAEINPCCSGNKMSFALPVNRHTTGQWKLRITNNTNDDTMNIDPKVTYTALCR